jgi:hypothetical protein
MLNRIGASVRYAAGLKHILRDPITLDEAREAIAARMADREETFLDTLERGVYAQPTSPYRKLLDNARLTLEDVRGLVRERGLEEALSALYEAGVYLTADEFKGRQPIRRPGLASSCRYGPRTSTIRSRTRISKARRAGLPVRRCACSSALT